MDFLTILALVIGPLVSVVVVVLNNRRSGKSNDAQVEVAAKEARTHEVEVLLDGYRTRVDDLDESLKEARVELKQARAEMQTQANLTQRLSERVSQLETDVVLLEEDRSKLLQYVAVIEAVLPEPLTVQRPELSSRRRREG